MPEYMKDRFELASHLTYVVECIATDLTGEAKFELSRIIIDLEASSIPERDLILSKLREATDWFHSGDYRRAAVVTVSASRKLQEGLKWPAGPSQNE